MPANSTNVVLTGFMGTGKSTVGQRLADRLGYRFVDTDRLIEERKGPIADLFANEGEAVFRALEAEVARDLGSRTGLVVATGGRLMLDPANAAALGNGASVICLAASVDTILERVLGDPSGLERPLLAGPDPAGRIAELLAERAEGYRRFVPVATDGRTVDEVVDAIIALLPTA